MIQMSNNTTIFCILCKDIGIRKECINAELPIKNLAVHIRTEHKKTGTEVYMFMGICGLRTSD